MLDFRIKTFLTLCQLKNYTKTAETLCITQPAVTQHIKYLENLYQVKLFEYIGKTLTLTPQGKKLQSFAITLENDLHKFIPTLQTLDSEHIHLKFGATLTIGEYIMGPIIKDFLKTYPSATLVMFVENTETLFSKLKSGEIDFAFIEGNFDKSDYSYRLLSREEFIGICSSQYALSHPKVCLEDLIKERILLRENGSGTRQVFEHLLIQYNMTLDVFPHICELGNLNMIKDLVANNLGISFLYKKAVTEELEKGLVHPLNIERLQVIREFNFVYLKNSQFEPVYLNFFDFVQEKIKNS